MTPRPFAQVDVFSVEPQLGNPVAVVLEADGLDTDAMQRFATWTNLSEATFVRPPTEPGADYSVRIFTPVEELPFAGHPTLGTCHAWAEHTGSAQDVVVQQCRAGLVEVRRSEAGWAFAAPPLRRTGPADESLVSELIDVLGVDRADVVAVEWVDNGPGWVAVLLNNAEAVLGVRPRHADRMVGVVGLSPAGSEAAIEVRAFFPKDGVMVEDPVTGSLNASLGQWLTASGRLDAPYVASQGAVLGRRGRVHVSIDDAGQIWVGGATASYVRGTVDL